MKDNVVSVFNILIEVCRDGESGFQDAADAVQQPTLRALLSEFAEQRRQFACQLQYEVAKLGETPETSGSVLGAFHRRWMDVKLAVSGGSAGVIVAECERGEDMAKRAYQKALAKALPEGARELIERQFSEVKTTHDRLRSLEVKTDEQPA